MDKIPDATDASIREMAGPSALPRKPSPKVSELPVITPQLAEEVMVIDVNPMDVGEQEDIAHASPVPVKPPKVRVARAPKPKAIRVEAAAEPLVDPRTRKAKPKAKTAPALVELQVIPNAASSWTPKKKPEPVFTPMWAPNPTVPPYLVGDPAKPFAVASLSGGSSVIWPEPGCWADAVDEGGPSTSGYGQRRSSTTPSAALGAPWLKKCRKSPAEKRALRLAKAARRAEAAWKAEQARQRADQQREAADKKNLAAQQAAAARQAAGARRAEAAQKAADAQKANAAQRAANVRKAQVAERAPKAPTAATAQAVSGGPSKTPFFTRTGVLVTYEQNHLFLQPEKPLAADSSERVVRDAEVQATPMVSNRMVDVQTTMSPDAPTPLRPIWQADPPPMVTHSSG